ncbi:MAG: esterase family protein, partial [Chloroflexi bacterium]|nr:esterase family protein [Chloroflexota bacterium]
MPASPTPAPACPSPGQSVTNAIASPTLHYPLTYRLYLPPCYADEAPARYPVLYLIHGLGYDETQWDSLGTGEAADRLILTGELPPFLIVMPLDRQDSRFGEALVADLLPHVDTVFRTRPEREGRAIGGLSRGAGWAVHVGLLHPELFGAVGAHSLAVFNSDAGHVAEWLDQLSASPRLYLDIGEDDSLLYSARWFEGLLAGQGIPHEWRLNPGGHNRAYWQAHVEAYLRWYAEAWQEPPGRYQDPEGLRDPQGLKPTRRAGVRLPCARQGAWREACALYGAQTAGRKPVANHRAGIPVPVIPAQTGRMARSVRPLRVANRPQTAGRKPAAH